MLKIDYIGNKVEIIEKNKAKGYNSINLFLETEKYRKEFLEKKKNEN